MRNKGDLKVIKTMHQFYRQRPNIMNLSRASNSPKTGFNLSQTLKKPECKESARYSNKVYFAGKYFVYIFEKLNY